MVRVADASLKRSRHSPERNTRSFTYRILLQKRKMIFFFISSVTCCSTRLQITHKSQGRIKEKLSDPLGIPRGIKTKLPVREEDRRALSEP